MDIEKEIFRRSIVNKNKLKNYGFIKEKDNYKYSKNFMDNSFNAEIIVEENGNIIGKVYDLLTNEEYTNFRIKDNTGEFVSKVKEEYKNILIDIKNNCFDDQYFIFSQSNRVTNYIINKYGSIPEFLWKKSDGSGVFRNKTNKKWFGIIMNIDKSKIDNGTGEIEILNIKLDDNIIQNLINEKGFYKAYHMNKKSWITIILNETIKDEIIFMLIDDSYDLINGKVRY